MRALASVLLVLTVGLLACDNEGLVVRVEGLSPDITALRVRFLRDGQAVGPDREITRTLQQFVVTGVEGGDYQLDIAGLGSDRCIVARQSQPISYRGGSLRPTDVSVRLSPDPNKPCPIRVTVDDGVSVTSTPKGIVCGNDTQGQPLRDCVIDIPRGNDLTLQGQTKDGFATYPAFSGLCLAIDSCLFKVEKAGEVRVVAAKRVCNKDGWCAQNPMPQMHSFVALWGFAADDIWAAGYQGTVLHFDGRSWASFDSGVKTDFQSAWGATSDDMWFVGFGTATPISHYYHGKWESFKSDSLSSIYGRSEKSIWAVGYSGLMTYYNGAEWKQSNNLLFAGPNYFTAAWISSAEDGLGWALDNDGNIAVLDKGMWTPAGQQLSLTYTRSIRRVGESLWLAGSGGVAKKERVNDRSNWVQYPFPSGIPKNTVLYTVFPVSESDIWFGGRDGIILHWNGKEFSEIQSTTNRHILSIWGASSADIWAVGDAGVMLHWDGKGWSQYSLNAAASQDLSKSWGAAANDVWAVGANGTITHWDGYRWIGRGANGLGNLNAIWGNSKNNIWAVGENGLILHYAGSSWADRSEQKAPTLTGIWLNNDGKIWTVSSRNAWQLQDGVLKSELEVPVTTAGSLRAIWGTSTANLFAVGESVGYQYNGSWQGHSQSDTLISIWGVPGRGPWAVSGRPREYVRQFTGSYWSNVFSSLNVGTYRGIWGRNLNDITVVGEQVTKGIFQYDGQSSTWKQTYQGNPSLFSVWGTSDGHMWAVGQYGTILHQGPPGSRPSPSP